MDDSQIILIHLISQAKVLLRKADRYEACMALLNLQGHFDLPELVNYTSLLAEEADKKLEFSKYLSDNPQLLKVFLKRMTFI